MAERQQQGNRGRGRARGFAGAGRGGQGQGGHYQGGQYQGQHQGGQRQGGQYQGQHQGGQYQGGQYQGGQYQGQHQGGQRQGGQHQGGQYQGGQHEGRGQQPPQQAPGFQAKREEPSTSRPQQLARAEGAVGGRGAMRGNRNVPVVLRTRPVNSTNSKQGSSGIQITLQTNYFKVGRKDNESIFQYRVDFNPPVESSRMMNALVFNLKPVIGGYLFDGTQLFTRHRLRSEEVEYPTKDSNSGQIYIIKLRKVGTIDGATEMALMIFNLINRKAMNGLKLTLIGRNYFDGQAKISIQQYGIDLYPGYVTSIRQHEQDVLMCAELTHRVMRTDTCYAMFKTCLNQGGNWRDNYKRMVLGTVVMANYGKNNTYTVNDVEFNTTPESSFETSNGKVTFLQYFKERYNIVIRDPRQPMLVSRAKPRDVRAGKAELIYLVPELFRTTGLTDEMRRNFNLMRTMGDHTHLSPDKRIERLEMFNRRLQNCEESAEVFRFWQTELDRRLVEVTGRVLAEEEILFNYNETSKVRAGPQADWQIAFRKNPMFLSVPLKKWFFIVSAGDQNLVGPFMNCMYAVANGMRFEMAKPQFEVIQNDSPAVYVDCLNRLVQQDPQMIFCVVSNDKADRYAAIKKKTCVERAIPTQVMKARTITPKGGNVRTLMSVATKVAIQMNCKLGGIPWVLKNPLSSIMVIGFDVCHDSRDKSKSFGAMVATLYEKGQKHPTFFSTVNHHSSGEELSNFMAQNVIKALHSYRADFGGALPKRIIIYRDGVGEGQLKYVYDHEVGAVKEKLNMVYKDSKSQLTFFVVNKRINTRLFHQRQNPVPGTIVDDVITLPERTDFFLVSQSVRQGTVSPTSYNILLDDSGLAIDQLQMYTFKQTHLYYNWSGSVGVPAVCQYAHKLAYLAGQFLHQAPNNQMEKKLYYL